MALADLPSSGSINFESTVRSTLHDWRDAIDNKAASTHSHSGGDVSISTVATYTALPNGSTEGELGVSYDYYDVWSWNHGDSDWTQVGINLKRAFLL